jgi:hypothetical protein
MNKEAKNFKMFCPRAVVFARQVVVNPIGVAGRFWPGLVFERLRIA